MSGNLVELAQFKYKSSFSDQIGRTSPEVSFFFTVHDSWLSVSSWKTYFRLSILSRKNQLRQMLSLWDLSKVNMTYLKNINMFIVWLHEWKKAISLNNHSLGRHTSYEYGSLFKSSFKIGNDIFEVSVNDTPLTVFLQNDGLIQFGEKSMRFLNDIFVVIKWLSCRDYRCRILRCCFIVIEDFFVGQSWSFSIVPITMHNNSIHVSDVSAPCATPFWRHLSCPSLGRCKRFS